MDKDYNENFNEDFPWGGTLERYEMEEEKKLINKYYGKKS